jgi:integrase
LGEALAALEVEKGSASTKAQKAFASAAIKLILLTGCRRGEIFSLKWGEVDLDAAVLHLKDSKTGPKDVYKAAAELLASMKPKMQTMMLL